MSRSRNGLSRRALTTICFALIVTAAGCGSSKAQHAAPENSDQLTQMRPESSPKSGVTFPSFPDERPTDPQHIAPIAQSAVAPHTDDTDAAVEIVRKCTQPSEMSEIRVGERPSENDWPGM